MGKNSNPLNSVESAFRHYRGALSEKDPCVMTLVFIQDQPFHANGIINSRLLERNGPNTVPQGHCHTINTMVIVIRYGDSKTLGG